MCSTETAPIVPTSATGRQTWRSLYKELQLLRMTAGEPMTNIVLQVNATDPADDELSLRSDGVLPQQIFQRQGSGALKPFSRLMYAILIDAVRCYQVNFDASRLSKKQQFSEAQAWL